MNQETLKKRWENIDKYLLDYLKDYNNTNKKTRDELQDLFNSIKIDYKDINKPISNAEKKKVDRFIEDLLMIEAIGSYFAFKCQQLLKRKNITYLEMLEIIVMGIYEKEKSRLKQSRDKLYLNSVKESYNQGLDDIKKTHKKKKYVSFKLPILYNLLNIPLFNATAEAYIDSLVITHSDEMLKKILLLMQLKKELNIDNPIFIELLNKQRNRYINFSDDKVSGSLTNIIESLVNLAYLEAGKQNDIIKCKFVAEMDNKTTKMCSTLNNQIFSINDWNTYSRYSDADKKNIIYHTYGMVQGENLPPINNHFHWCRSTITYQIEK